MRLRPFRSLIAAGFAAALLLVSSADAAYREQPGLFATILSGPPSSVSTSYTTWVNQSNATESDTALGMVFNAPSNGGQHIVNALVKTAPSTPYVATLLILWGNALMPYDDANALIGWYDGSNAFDVLAINPFYGPLAWSHNTYASYSAPANAPNPAQFCGATPACYTYAMNPVSPPANYLWVQLSNNGTQITVSASLDGENYSQLYSFPIYEGFLVNGYTDLAIGADAHLGPTAFTVVSYVDPK